MSLSVNLPPDVMSFVPLRTLYVSEPAVAGITAVSMMTVVFFGSQRLQGRGRGRLRGAPPRPRPRRARGRAARAARSTSRSPAGSSWRAATRTPSSRCATTSLAIFRDLGFVVAAGPEVELEENNFTKLGFPPDHPATDMQDSFWVDARGRRGRDASLLRTHTINVQIREMLDAQAAAGGASRRRSVYRRDDDARTRRCSIRSRASSSTRASASPTSRACSRAFAERVYGAGTPGALPARATSRSSSRASSSTSAACSASGRDGSRAGCRVCKHTGWLEVLGCGMIHPERVRALRHRPREVHRASRSAWASIGVAMLRYGIPNIKLLFENDPRFLDAVLSRHATCSAGAMKASHNWLRELSPARPRPRRVAARAHPRGPRGRGDARVRARRRGCVVAAVVSVAAAPDQERAHASSRSTAARGAREVVCGAPNVPDPGGSSCSRPSARTCRPRA